MRNSRSPPPRLALTLVLLSATALSACQSAAVRTASDLERLQGLWQGAGPGGGCTVTIAGNSLHFKAREDFWYETTFTLPAGTQPRQLHATITNDYTGEPEQLGRVVVALFAFNGDTLTLGVIDDFDEPPASPLVVGWNRTSDRFYLRRVQPHGNGRG